MDFYPAPCEVVEADVAGFGPRLYLTGTRLLASVWDKLIAEARDACREAADDAEAVAWVVRQHGLRSLSPVTLHERVGVLLSLERLDDSSTLRLDYRITHESGDPAACAFMVLESTNRLTGAPAPIPQWLVHYCTVRGGFDERVASRSFVERAIVLPGACESLFPDDVRVLGARVATQATAAVVRRRTPTTTSLSVPTLGALDVPDGNTGFFFPDIDAYDGKLLCELRAYLPYLADYFDQAEEVARRVFRHAFLPLVDSDTLALHDQRLERCPELAHVGVVLTGVLIAELLKEHGILPHALIGDGLGELAACAVSGATELSTALRLAAMRAIAMRPVNGSADTSGAEQFAAALAEVRFEQPLLPIVSLRAHGLLAPGRGSGSVAGWLPLGGSAAVADIIAAARGAGCDHVIECGPRGVLHEAPSIPATLLRRTFDVEYDARA
jgi:acyl-CoA thioesterase FadM